MKKRLPAGLQPRATRACWVPLAKSDKMNGQVNKGPTDLSQHQPLPAGGLGGGQPRLYGTAPPVPPPGDRGALTWGKPGRVRGPSWSGEPSQLHSVGALRGDARPAGAG